MQALDTNPKGGRGSLPDASPPGDRLPLALALVGPDLIPWLQEATRDLVALLPVSPADNLPKLLTQTRASLLLVEFPGQQSVAERLGTLLEVFPHLQLLALGRTEDRDSLLAAVRAKVSDFIDSNGSPADLRRAMHKALQREQWLRSQRQQKLISIAGGVGTGCTTMAVNLATVYQKYFPEKEILVLDFGTPTGDALVYCGLQSALTFAEAVGDLSRCDQSYLRNGLAYTANQVAILPLFREASDLRGLRVQDGLQLLNILLTLFDIVIADVGNDSHSETGRYLLHHADSLLVLTDQSVRGLLAARRILGTGSSRSTNAQALHLLVSQYDDELAISPAQISRELDVPLLGDGFLPERRRTLIQAVNRGLPVVEVAARDSYTTHFEALAGRLAETVWPEVPDNANGAKKPRRFLPKPLRKRWPW